VGRYIQTDLPIGFAIDGIMILTFLAIIFLDLEKGLIGLSQ
jgi:hypothetical protein